jgi:ABC-type sulfate/molybdate transport systems ATPase subunit
LREVDLDIAAGEVVAICGDNGAGKSSLIRIMSGAAMPGSGTMLLRGNTVRFRRHETRWPRVSRRSIRTLRWRRAFRSPPMCSWAPN